MIVQVSLPVKTFHKSVTFMKDLLTDVKFTFHPGGPSRITITGVDPDRVAITHVTVIPEIYQGPDFNVTVKVYLTELYKFLRFVSPKENVILAVEETDPPHLSATVITESHSSSYHFTYLPLPTFVIAWNPPPAIFHVIVPTKTFAKAVRALTHSIKEVVVGWNAQDGVLTMETKHDSSTGGSVEIFPRKEGLTWKGPQEGIYQATFYSKYIDKFARAATSNLLSLKFGNPEDPLTMEFEDSESLQFAYSVAPLRNRAVEGQA